MAIVAAAVLLAGVLTAASAVVYADARRQERHSGSTAAPQAGQAIASGEPQSEQNFRPGRFLERRRS